jgi:uncharacterized membrane protein
MNLYILFVFIHVAAAVALLSGSVIAAPHVRSAVRRARTTQELRAFLAIGRPLLVLEPAAALVVLASGVYLTSVAHFWALGWVQVAVAFWLVNTAVAAAVVKPAIGRVAAEAASAEDRAVGPRLDALRWSPRWSFGGDLLMANDAAMLFLMTMKPGLGGSLLAVAAANALVLVARGAGHWTRSSRAAAGRYAPAIDGERHLASAPLTTAAVAPLHGAGGELPQDQP